MSIQFPKLGLDLEFVPKSFVIGGFEITIYGILIALGMLLGLLVILREGKRNKQNTNDLLGMLITALIFGIIGARFAYVLFSMPRYRYNPMDILNLRQGGMVYYGGLFGGLFGGIVYSVIRDISFGALADTAVFGLLISQVIGRWGDFFSRSSFGGFTDWVTCMQLPLEAVRADEVSSSLRDHLITQSQGTFIQVHPVFLYESLWCLLLLVFFLAGRRKKLFDGEILLKYLVWYAFGRFFFDLLRTDRVLLPEINFPVSSAVSAGLFLFCGIMLLIRRSIAGKRNRIQKRRKEEFQAAMEQAEAEVEKIGLEGVMAELAEANKTDKKRKEEDTEEGSKEEELKEEELKEEEIKEEGSKEAESDHLEVLPELEEPENIQTPDAAETTERSEVPKDADVSGVSENMQKPENSEDIKPEISGYTKASGSETDRDDSGFTEAIDRTFEDLDIPASSMIPQMPEIRTSDSETMGNADKTGQNPEIDKIFG